MQVDHLGKLLKDWGLIPQEHNIDANILFGIIDKDRDDFFSYDDFLKNFPRYDSHEVDEFMDKNGKKIGKMFKNGWEQEDSDPFGSDGSVSISSLDSE